MLSANLAVMAIIFIEVFLGLVMMLFGVSEIESIRDKQKEENKRDKKEYQKRYLEFIFGFFIFWTAINQVIIMVINMGLR